MILQVEICRFGCPDHCQKPNSYQAREQEVSSSINIPQYRPGPRYEAQKTATAAKRVDTREELSNEIPEAAADGVRRVAEPQVGPQPLPLPQRLVQEPATTKPSLEEKTKRDQPYQNPAAFLVKNLPPPPKQAPPRYIPRPDGPPRQLPPNLPETDKKSANTASFFGFKLPQIPPFPWGNNENQFGGGPRVESQVSPVSMGVTPPRRTASVPVSRTKNGEQPQVFPSGFNSNARPVEPIEPFETNADSQFPYGPRGLKFNKRSGARSKRDLSEEMGVRSGYQVISEVDLAFKPSFEDGMGVTVFQVRNIQSLCNGSNSFFIAGSHLARGDCLRSLLASHWLLGPLRADLLADRHLGSRLRLRLLPPAVAEGGGGRRANPTNLKRADPTGMGRRHPA